MMAAPAKQTQATVPDLQLRKRQLQTKLVEAEAAHEKALKDRDTDEAYSVIESRPPNPKLTREIGDKIKLVDDIRHQLRYLDRAIDLLQQTAMEDRETRRAARIKKFRSDSARQVKRLELAMDDVENAALEFFEFYESQEDMEAIDLMSFLFPARVPSQPLDDMQRRFGRLNLLNAAMGSLANRAKKA